MNEIDPTESRDSTTETDVSSSESPWRLLGRAFAHAPVLCSYAVCFFGLAIGTMFGLPRGLAWNCVGISIVLGIASFLARDFWSELKSSIPRDDGRPLIVRLVAQSPGASLILAWVLGTGVAFLFGLSSDIALQSLMLATVLAFVLLCIRDIGKQWAERKWSAFGGYGLAALYVAGTVFVPPESQRPFESEWDWRLRQARNQPIRPAGEIQIPNADRQPPETLNTPRFSTVYLEPQGQPTQAYWKTAVADLHLLRFERPESEEDSQLYFDRQIEEFELRVGNAKKAYWPSIDSDLTAMASEHLDEDEKLLALVAEFKQFGAQKNRNVDSESVSDLMIRIVEFLDSVESEDTTMEELAAQLNAPVHLVEGLFFMIETLHDQFLEIEAMQKTLRERYPEFDFDLPDLGISEDEIPAG